jgi:positive regulator of sigma E activity
MRTIQEHIVVTMQDATDCSQCKHRQTCDRTPLQNAWRSLQQTCSKWVKWNEK